MLELPYSRSWISQRKNWIFHHKEHKDGLRFPKALCLEEGRGVDGISSDIASALLKILDQWNVSPHWTSRSDEPKTVYPVSSSGTSSFIIKVYPALISWAGIYDGKRRHEQHLQHFRPRCVHLDLLGQAHEVCCRRILILHSPVGLYYSPSLLVLYYYYELHSSVFLQLRFGIFRALFLETGISADNLNIQFCCLMSFLIHFFTDVGTFF